MRRPRPRRHHDDSGAALIVAICFVVMVGAISAGLAGLATSSLNNRGTLEAVRNREYAADGAIEKAIIEVRKLAGSPLVACSAKPSGLTTARLNEVAIRVDWRYVCGVVRGSDGTVVAQRTAVFVACENTAAACADSAVIISARVNFAQASSGAVTATYVQSWSVTR